MKKIKYELNDLIKDNMWNLLNLNRHFMDQTSYVSILPRNDGHEDAETVCIFFIQKKINVSFWCNI